MLSKTAAFLLALFFFLPAFAEQPISPNEFTERILLFQTRAGEPLYDGLIAHEIDRTLYISALDIFETLGFQTEFSLNSRVFNANTVTPEMNVSITWPKCSLKINQKEESLSCQSFAIYEDEFFISLDLATKILSGEFEYLPFKSELRYFTEVPYPAISKLKRKQSASSPSPHRTFNPGFKEKKAKPQSLKNFFLDQQLSWIKEYKKPNKVQYYSNLSTDVLKHEVAFTSQGDSYKHDFNTWLVKRDFYSDEENPYVSTYQIGDISTPSAEIIGGPGSGTGFYITNRKQELIAFGQRDFEGNLRPGWEVELYVNDNLFDRSSANESGRYRFQNIPIEYGSNSFRLEFYGPQGERKTKYINNNISYNNLNKGQLRYELGTTKDKQGKTESLAQLSFGLTNSLSTYLGYAKYNLFDTGRLKDFSIFGLNGFGQNINYSLFYGNDYHNNGNFYAARTQFQAKRVRLQLNYLKADKFQTALVGSRTKFLDTEYKANLSFNLFGRASFLYRYKHDLFEDQTESKNLLQNIVFSLRRFTFLFKNELFNGYGNQFDLIYTRFSNQFRYKLSYDNDRLTDSTLEFRNRFKRESSISLGLNKNHNTNVESIKAGYQHKLDKFAIGLEASSDFNKDYSLLASLRSSFGQTKSAGFHISSDRLASRGNVCAKVYFDINQDGILDTKIDRPVKKAAIRWVQGNLDFKSDKYGNIILSNLPLYTPVDVQLLVKNLGDQMLKPVEVGYRVHLQRGQCREVNFLVKKTYDFEGQVFSSNPENYKRLVVQLTDAYGKVLEKTRTDKDGYFLFEELPAKIYYMQLKNKKLRSEPSVYIINPYNNDSLDQDFYFDTRD